MEDSLQAFYEYLGSEEELMYSVRIHAAWDEESFLNMRRLARAVMAAWGDRDWYPKRFVAYFMRDLPAVVHMLRQFRSCSAEEAAAGWTEAAYLDMIAERARQLEELQLEFLCSLERGLPAPGGA